MPGTYVAQAATGITDRVCAACTSGTYTSTTNADGCKTWSTCEAGSFVSTDPAASRNRGCTACAPGTMTTGTNQSICVADSECAPGTQQTLAGTCEPCAAGEYCAGAAAAAVACANDEWDHDKSPATACVARTICAAGSRMLHNGSATADRACLPCSAGTYSLTANSALCYPWANCAAGSFVSNTPSSNSDRKCSPCASGTYTALENQSVCLAVTDCAAGTVEKTAATATTAAVCQDCVAGQFCAGGKAPAIACPDDMWDHDSNPATVCASKTVCTAGTYAVDRGTAKTDRVCLACEAGTFSTTGNATACTKWADCAAGTYVSVPGTVTSDRRCEACTAGTYTSMPNQTACVTAKQCEPGTVRAAAPSPTEPQTCKDCRTGEYCAGDAAPALPCAGDTWDHDGDPATVCAAKATCPAGTYVAQDGNATQNRTCEPCADGNLSTTSNATACVAWSVCVPGTFMTNTPPNLPSATIDRVCQACPDGQYSSLPNQSSCVPIGQCAAGTVQTVAGTPSSPPTCVDCSVGQYCAGGLAEAVDCAAGTWDDDASPATICAAWRTCDKGYYVTTPAPSATTNRSCLPCAAGTFTDAVNQESCTAWAVCTVDTQYETVAPTSQNNRGCAACSDNGCSAFCQMDGTCFECRNDADCTGGVACNNSVCGVCVTRSLASAFGIPVQGASSGTIAVPDTMTVKDVNLRLAVTHTWLGDIGITLEHSGTTVSLYSRSCGSFDNLDVTFDDMAAGGFDCNDRFSPPSYEPVGLLSEFNGQASAGNWVLTVTDYAWFDSGTVTAADLTVCGTPIN